MIGYTVNFRNKVFAADDSKPGVQLGRAAIKRDIPIAAIAMHMGVSRMTVYDWFVGRFNMSDERADVLQQFIAAR